MAIKYPPKRPGSVIEDFIHTMTKVRRHYDIDSPGGAQRLLHAFDKRSRGKEDPDVLKLMEAAMLVIRALEPKEKVGRKCPCGHELWKDVAGNVLCTIGHEGKPTVVR